MTSKSQQKVLTIAVFIVAAGLFALFGPGGWLGSGKTAGGVDAADAALVALGKTVYADNCASCHGVELEGQPDWRTRNPDGTLKAPPHDETGHTWHHPDQQLFALTKFGGQQSAPAGFQSNMPPFEGRLSDREIRAVLAYIRSRWPAAIQERQRRITERAR